MVMVIYNYVQIIGELLLPLIFLYTIYDNRKNYMGKPVNIHIQSLINVIQDKNRAIIKKRVRVNYHYFVITEDG